MKFKDASFRMTSRIIQKCLDVIKKTKIMFLFEAILFSATQTLKTELACSSKAEAALPQRSSKERAEGTLPLNP